MGWGGIRTESEKTEFFVLSLNKSHLIWKCQIKDFVPPRHPSKHTFVIFGHFVNVPLIFKRWSNNRNYQWNAREGAAYVAANQGWHVDISALFEILVIKLHTSICERECSLKNADMVRAYYTGTP